jgi:SAM-dependent methyltransferase
VLHENRRRAEAFGEYAEQYDRARPTYPGALVDAICREGDRRVLDVGCGTGKAAVLFAARNCTVLGVEVDERMAAVARHRGIPVEVAPFEIWDPAGRMFDLVVSGQAWHWVDPHIGPAKAADVLTDHGRLAAFWNYEEPSDAALAADVEAAYEASAPELQGSGIGRAAHRRHAAETAERARSIRSSGRFAHCTVCRFSWTWELRRDEFLNLVRTHSGVAILPEERRAALLERLATTIGSVGEIISLACATECIIADKAA